jgi:hypothetical protein
MHWIDHEDIDLGNLRARGLEFRENYMKALGPETYAFYLDWLAHIEKETGRSPR